MSKWLTATGAFKRMSGSWLPDSDRFLYEKTDRIFRKRNTYPIIEQVGGGVAGQAASESARILFWNETCKLCEINLATVFIRTGLANTGKLVLTMSHDKDFDSGWFVAVESTASQITVPALTALDGSALRTGHRVSRTHTRRFDGEAIQEDSSFIEWRFPSLNVIGFSSDSVTDPYFDNVNTFNRLGSLGLYNYYSYGESRLWVMQTASPTASDLIQFNVRAFKVTCGTVSSGSLTTLSTQSVWTGINTAQVSDGWGEMWLGLGDNFIKAGLGKNVFLPEMTLTNLQRDRMQQNDRYWKVEAIPGDILTIKSLTTSESVQTSCLAAPAASGTMVLGTHVTQSPKARTQRASLVTSPQGLIWAGGVLPGINESHTKKAARTPATVFPFEQPPQAIALSIGAAKANPSSLTAIFTTTASTNSVDGATGKLVTTPASMDDDALKPIVTARQIISQDETGLIGRTFTSFYGTDSTQVPQNAPWQGVFADDLALMQATPPESPINWTAGYYYGGSNQTQQWTTSKTDSYTLEVESLAALPYALWDGTYVATNVMPDGTPSAPDYFYASPELDGIQSIPTLSKPGVLSAVNNAYGSSLVGDGMGYGYGDITPIWSWSHGIPFLHSDREWWGRVITSGAFGQTTVIEIDTSYHKVQYRADTLQDKEIAGWKRGTVTHANTTAKLSAQVNIEATRTLIQIVSLEQAKSEGWITGSSNQVTGTPEPRSEFYKATTTKFDDYMTRLCAAAKVTVVKSCRYIPQQTQMFMQINRETYADENRLPGGWGYYGGTVPESDKLEMLDQYESGTVRYLNEPTGGSITVFLRRTWQIEAVVATGSPTYKSAEVVDDSLQVQSVVGVSNYYSGPLSPVTTTFTGKRKARFGVEFDIENAETITHLMNHQQIEQRTFRFTEAEWDQLEAGGTVEKDVYAASASRLSDPTGNAYSAEDVRYINTTTKVAFQFT